MHAIWWNITIFSRPKHLVDSSSGLRRLCKVCKLIIYHLHQSETSVYHSVSNTTRTKLKLDLLQEQDN